MKKIFRLIIIAIMLFTVTEVTAKVKVKKEHYIILASDKSSIELAKYTVTKLELDTTDIQELGSQGDSIMSVLLTFNIDKFKFSKKLILIASVEIQILPEQDMFIPVDDVVIGLLNTQSDKDKFVKNVRVMITRLINRYIKDKVHR